MTKSYEKFTINQGEPDSYNLYDVNGGVVTGTTPNNIKVTDFYNSARAGGAQVFPGFRPANAISKVRNSFALYTDLELDVTEKWLVNGAVRFENYSDFGSTTNFKVATRYKLTDNIKIYVEQFLQDLEHLHCTKSILILQLHSL